MNTVDIRESRSDQRSNFRIPQSALAMPKKVFVETGVVLCLLLFVAEASAQTMISNLCFDLGIPSNAASNVLLDADDNPYNNQTIGQLEFAVRYKEDPSDPWSDAGAAEYLMQTDASGILVDNGGTLCADFGGPISNVSQFEIAMNVNAGEWQAPGLRPWTLDNLRLTGGSGNLIAWDYEVDANASYVDPLISSTGGFGDAWSGDLVAPSVTGGVLEFTFPEGGGGGGSHVYSVAAVPEPSSLFLLAPGTCGWLVRRRK